MNLPMFHFNMNFQTDQKPILSAFPFLILAVSTDFKHFLSFQKTCAARHTCQWNRQPAKLQRRKRGSTSVKSTKGTEEQASLQCCHGLTFWDFRGCIFTKLGLFHHSLADTMNSISQWFQNDLGRSAYYWKTFLFYRDSLFDRNHFSRRIFLFPAPQT